jgi:putative Ca2+/H+ antiporter (TMEM165/GDT1 family)
MNHFFTVFFTILVAEIGDKTQLATMLFATDDQTGRTAVFVASAAALVTSSAIAVVAGGIISRFVPEATLKIAAGIGFIIVGAWTLASSR